MTRDIVLATVSATRVTEISIEVHLIYSAARGLNEISLETQVNALKHSIQS